jgi:hypothetical protein
MTIVFLIALATYRITHLVVFDKISEPIRNLFVRREVRNYFGEPFIRYTLQGGRLRRFVGKILNCPWCASVWIGAFLTALYVYGPRGVTWVYVFLAAASVTGLLETWWTKTVGFPAEMVDSGKYAEED